ncbi:MAG: hypothetical protein OEV68_14830, partial [candidate division Zixibacteria bacterium]|nr:hypothetical protein [candidate division Zixibacteria bacterium]
TCPTKNWFTNCATRVKQEWSWKNHPQTGFEGATRNPIEARWPSQTVFGTVGNPANSPFDSAQGDTIKPCFLRFVRTDLGIA